MAGKGSDAMGSIEFITQNLKIIDKQYVYIKEPEHFHWCNYKYLCRADFSLVNNQIYVNTRDFSSYLDEYYLKKCGVKHFYIVPENYDASKHYSFVWQEVTKERFIDEYKKRLQKGGKYGKGNLCTNENKATKRIQ